MKDFYYILGADATATPEEIREAFRQLSKRFSTDADSEDMYAKNHYREICEAFAVLSDATRRMRYDAALRKAGLFPGQLRLPSQRAFNSVDIAFTIVLILITLLFGDYVVRSITGTKQVKSKLVAVLPRQEANVAHPHKKKGKKLKQALIVKEKIAPVNKWKPKPDSVRITAMSRPTATVVNPPQSAPITVQAAKPLSAPVYPTYLRASNAGAIYMRKDDHYGANGVTIIPDNAKVMVLGEGENFYKVNYNNTIGYVLKRSVLPLTNN